MHNQSLIQSLKAIVGDTVFLDEPLAKHTTIGIGGPAEYLVTVNAISQLIQLQRLAKESTIPLFVLGGGSNVVIGDGGIQGLVIKNQLLDLSITDGSKTVKDEIQLIPRLTQLDKDLFYKTSSNTSFNQNTEKVMVTVGSGWKLTALMQHCLTKKISGLEWFSGIPGSVGGAVYMNIHGGSYFFSDFVKEVSVLTEEGQIKRYDKDEIQFDYDYSIFHQTRDIILSVTLELYYGDNTIARKIMTDWGSEKIKKQPQRSAGCIFQNITKEDQEKLGLPTSSIGFMIDKILGLSGKQIGGARISPKHAAFIENMGGAKATDVVALVQLIEEAVKEKFGISLIREVEFINC